MCCYEKVLPVSPAARRQVTSFPGGHKETFTCVFLDATVQTDVSLGTGYSLTYSFPDGSKLLARETGTRVSLLFVCQIN